MLSNSSTAQVGGLWTIRVRAPARDGAASPDLQGALILAGGALISVLTSILLLLLAGSRQRALRLVDQATGRLHHQTLYDSLTGLPNRLLALDRADQMLAGARREHLPVAALCLDIDGFKHVNETFGHARGDEFLGLVAERLRSVVREGDTAARLAGDEFVVLVERATFDASPELVAQRLLEVLRQPYELAGIERGLSIAASIGIASSLRGSGDELLRNAAVAMHEAKTAGKNRCVVFRSSMQTAIQDRLALEMDLHDAVKLRQLTLQYQPILDLRSGRPIALEALIRWDHPLRGRLDPGKFIPLAEQSGLIVPIGRWVLDTACQQAKRWERHGHHLQVTVNVSARQLDDDALIEDVHAALEGSGLDPGKLVVEVTETTLMRDPRATAKRLERIKALGVRIAIDDFGTGYSSMAYLRQFPTDTVKIDRSFMSDLATSKKSPALVHTLIQLGKSLEIVTLAEGIEDLAQLDALRQEQCDQGQGFLFSRPLDADAVEGYLNSLDDSRAPHLMR
ncbi:MAG: putative bifunctional diguanylate cyclase/phosphodiesterase, partial [Solirubrobacteraceae bacterium]